MSTTTFSDEDMKILETGISEWRSELEKQYSNSEYERRSKKELLAEMDKYDRILTKLRTQG